ncbi:MAG: tryptophan synthase subunit beta [Amaricoccus sp.]|uniref:tryptophan synthase subunit beta n=1 Tax=Amaricoccus sp. TaxID=1872485 RepID=UPI0039E64AE0
MMIAGNGITFPVKGEMLRSVLKDKRRLHRQFEALARAMPVTRPVTERLLRDGMRVVRLPAAFVLILGGCFSFLPVLGIWMLPLGIMLLAVDVPFIRPTVAANSIRSRRRLSVFWRERVRRRRRLADEQQQSGGQ